MKTPTIFSACDVCEFAIALGDEACSNPREPHPVSERQRERIAEFTEEANRYFGRMETRPLTT